MENQRRGHAYEDHALFNEGVHRPPDHSPAMVEPSPQTALEAAGVEHELLPSGYQSDVDRDAGLSGTGAKPAHIGITERVVAEPEVASSAGGVEVEIIDVAKLEANERKKHLDRVRKRNQLQQLREAVLSGDADALQEYERFREQNRQALRRWRQNHPEQVREDNQKYYRLRRSRGE